MRFVKVDFRNITYELRILMAGNQTNGDIEVSEMAPYYEANECSGNGFIFNLCWSRWAAQKLVRGLLWGMLSCLAASINWIMDAVIMIAD